MTRPPPSLTVRRPWYPARQERRKLRAARRAKVAAAAKRILDGIAIFAGWALAIFGFGVLAALVYGVAAGVRELMGW